MMLLINIMFEAEKGSIKPFMTIANKQRLGFCFYTVKRKYFIMGKYYCINTIIEYLYIDSMFVTQLRIFFHVLQEI